MQASRPQQVPVPPGHAIAASRKIESDFKSLAAASYLRSGSGRERTLSFDIKPSSGPHTFKLTPAVKTREVNAFTCMAIDRDNDPQGGDDRKELPQTGSASDSEGSQTDGSVHSSGSVGGGYVRRPSMERTWHGTTVSWHCW